jgi:hypothetical protein
MKKTCQYFILLGFIVLSACSTVPEKPTASLSAEDSLKIRSWNAFFGDGQKDTSTTESLTKVDWIYRPVPNAYTNDCIARYTVLFEKPTQADLALLKSAFTTSIEFNKDGIDAGGKGKPLHVWINNLVNQSNFDGFSICFGVYIDPGSYTFDTNTVTDGKIKAYLKTRVGRLTAFIRPKFTGSPSPSNPGSSSSGGEDFNLGNLKP